MEQLIAQTQLAHKQLAQAKVSKGEEDIKLQGKTLTAFTVVNVLFLPLAFFTQASTAFTSMLILFLTEISLIVFQPWQQ